VPQGGNEILFEGLILTMGMKGWEPGGKEWPTSLTFKQVGGSNSSLRASSNLFFFIELKRVFPPVFPVV
jgi:hypothetical protein